MSTDGFRRHTRSCVDAALHRAYFSLSQRPQQRSFFERVLRVVQQRTELMATRPTVGGELVQTSVLLNLSLFEHALVRQPEEWSGATGHPLRVVDALTTHLFGRYPTPRFLASVWFGGDAGDRLDRRRWFIAHAQGQRFRSLGLPLAMTRQMEHIFLRTPDHIAIDHALRRAEVLGLGGTPELTDVVLSTALAEQFGDAERWRRALVWLVGCGDTVDLVQVRPVIDFLRAHLHVLDLKGRTFASVLRLVRDWHARLARARMRFVAWQRSRWDGLTKIVEQFMPVPRREVWSIVELLDSTELLREGRAMRHCVATYTHACAARRSSIWSLRHRWENDEQTESVLTIEVEPATGTIVQVRSKANGRPTGWPLELTQHWAARERLQFRRHAV